MSNQGNKVAQKEDEKPPENKDMEIRDLNYREFKVAVRKKLSEMQENMGNLMSSEKQKN